MRPWMSACLPLPPIRVVFSLSTTIRLMWPRSSSPVFSSLKPSSSAITLPPVTVATSVSRSLRSEEHTSELQSQSNLVCRLLLEKKKSDQKVAFRIDHRSFVIEGLYDRL